MQVLLVENDMQPYSNSGYVFVEVLESPKLDNAFHDFDDAVDVPVNSTSEQENGTDQGTKKVPKNDVNIKVDEILSTVRKTVDSTIKLIRL